MRKYILIFAKLAQNITFKEMNNILEALMESDTLDLRNISEDSLTQIRKTTKNI